MKRPIYNLKNEVVGEVNLPDSVFARPWNPDLVQQALLAQTANRRDPLAHAKGRGEVRGGGRKPWRQKGTGRARHGSIRSPIWKGGGVTHGPNKERVFSKKINKKMLRTAIYSVLSKRLELNELKFVDSLDSKSHKTKELASALKGFFKKTRTNEQKSFALNVLLLTSPNNKNVILASQNIPKVKSLNPQSLNIEDILKYKNILIDQKALEYIK